ncbi:MAG TPA: GNAT family N-acetyltransferase [Flavipsychrobacter sp.]
MDRAIINNLFDLYAFLGSHSLISIDKAGPFHIINSERSVWPSMAYNPDEDYSEFALDDLFNSLTHSSCKTVIVGGSFSKTLLPFFKMNRYMPVTQWYNMAKNLLSNEDIHLIEGLNITLCNTDQLLDDWTSVVSNVLFKNETVDKNLFINGVKKGVFKLILGKMHDVAVSTVLVYCGETAGIYMVATLPEYQKKGIGKAMMGYAEQLVYESGYPSALLHSTQSGLPLYKSLGYTLYDTNVLFYNFN